jgi:hypothetical protein
MRELLGDDKSREIQALQQVAHSPRGAHGMPVVSDLQAPLVLAVIRTLEDGGVK